MCVRVHWITGKPGPSSLVTSARPYCEIQFFPQGLVMSFYGLAGSLLSTYLWQGLNV